MCAQSCPTLCSPIGCSPPGFSVNGIFQVRILNGLPFPMPGYLPDPGIEPASPVSPALAGGFFTTEPHGKPHFWNLGFPHRNFKGTQHSNHGAFQSHELDIDSSGTQDKQGANQALEFDFFFFLATPLKACGTLVPQPGIKPMSPAVEVWSLNHWTTMEVPNLIFLPSPISCPLSPLSPLTGYKLVFPLLEVWSLCPFSARICSPEDCT